jgi:hypothetical protein
MSSLYNGLPGNESLHASFAIASSTNATPIVVTTGLAHDLSEGDYVSIQDHATNTAANGIYPVHVINGTQFSLYTSVSSGGLSGPIAGTGVGGASGTVRGLGLLPSYAIPSDGDALTASSVNVAFEDLGDRTQYAMNKTGVWKKVFVGFRSINSVINNLPTTLGTCNVIGQQWLREQTAAPVTNLDCFTSGGPDVLNGDIVDAEYMATLDTTVAGHSQFYLGIGFEYYEEGASPAVAVNGITSKVAGSAITPLDNFSSQTVIVRSRFVVSTAVTRYKKLQMYIAAREIVTTGGGTAWGFSDDLQWNVRIYRSTGLWE